MYTKTGPLETTVSECPVLVYDPRSRGQMTISQTTQSFVKTFVYTQWSVRPRMF